MTGKLVKAALALASVALFALLALGAAPAGAADRPYDTEVRKMIEAANGGLATYVTHMRSETKGAKVTRDGAEYDLGNFLDDFKAEGVLLEQRFGGDNVASGNLLTFLRMAKANDAFLERHPGFSGADSEWAALRPSIQNLAAAYRIDWAADPATWKPLRTPDQRIASQLADLEKQVAALAKEVKRAGSDAKVDAAALAELNGSVDTLRGAVKTLRSTFSKQVPFAKAAEACFGAVDKVDAGIVTLGLVDATTPTMAPVRTSVKSLTAALEF